MLGTPTVEPGIFCKEPTFPALPGGLDKITVPWHLTDSALRKHQPSFIIVIIYFFIYFYHISSTLRCRCGKAASRSTGEESCVLEPMKYRRGYSQTHRAWLLATKSGLGSRWTAPEWMRPGPREVVQGLWPFNGGEGRGRGLGEQRGDQPRALPFRSVTADVGRAAGPAPGPRRRWPLPSGCSRGWWRCCTGGRSSIWW